MSAQAEVRQRKKAANAAAQPVEESNGKAKQPAQKKKTPVDTRVRSEDKYVLWMDLLRVLTFCFFASCGLSYLISNGESFFWGVQQPPDYLRADWWKAQLRGPIRLTPEELAQYTGKDTTLPVYLAINGTIYDVSANRRTYGPGGSYHNFAGADAARAYVTGCFSEDRTADLRGAEEMFLPIDDATIDSHWTTEEMVALKKQELAEAQARVHDALEHWVNFFKHNKKYQKVGYVKREHDWLEKEPKKELCKQAKDNRRKREVPAK